jgi:hypothetical protein
MGMSDEIEELRKRLLLVEDVLERVIRACTYEEREYRNASLEEALDRLPK